MNPLEWLTRLRHLGQGERSVRLGRLAAGYGTFAVQILLAVGPNQHYLPEFSLSR